MKYEREHVYDLIGIGFGPANLALAIALQECADDGRASDCCFIESKPAFQWHGGMLLDGTRMQISFMKDLATLCNPQSYFTFVNYLHQQGRLNHFINLGTFCPARVEYNEYLSWAAAHFDDQVHYANRVESVLPVCPNGDQVELLKVVSRSPDGRSQVRYARNLVVGSGGQPKVPECLATLKSNRIVHSSGYRFWRDKRAYEADAPRIAIIGAGQSAAEVFVDLLDHVPDVKLDLINRQRMIHPSDDSPFVNEIFNPEYTDEIYAKPDAQRRELIARFGITNYSVVDEEELTRLYHTLYMQRVTGRATHRYLPCHELTTATLHDGQAALTLQDQDSGEQTTTLYDGVVLATGYSHEQHHQLLSGLTPWMTGLPVERHYRLPLSADCQPAIFLQGACESTHGLSDTLLSVMPVRAREIIEALREPLERQTLATRSRLDTASVLKSSTMA